MRIDRGIVLSVAGHGAFLVWALISFARPLETKPYEAITADIISADDFSKMGAASSLPQKEAPQPVVEKIAEPKQPDDLSAKVNDKKEVTAATDENHPEPAPKKPDPEPAAAPPEPKQEAKAADKKEPEQKIDPIAEALKKDETKKPEKEKKVENKPQPVKKPEPRQPKFDPRQVSALLDKRDPTRLAAAGAITNPLPFQGARSGDARTVSASEIAALAARLKNNWRTPLNVPPTMKIRIFLSMKRDGTLAAPPQVVTGGSGGVYDAMRDSTIRAIMASQPFDMLRPSTYDIEGGWKELDLTFNPTDFM